MKVNMSEIDLNKVERLLKKEDSSLSLGGHWKPHDCLPRWKVRHKNISYLFLPFFFLFFFGCGLRYRKFASQKAMLQDGLSLLFF